LEREPSVAGLERAIDVLTAIEALYKSCSPLQIESSFKHSGLYPWSVEAALRNPRINPEETITIENRKRRGMNMDGFIVTDDSFLDSLRNYETEHPRKNPKKKKLFHTASGEGSNDQEDEMEEDSYISRRL
jgi:hypothetical protein